MPTETRTPSMPRTRRRATAAFKAVLLALLLTTGLVGSAHAGGGQWGGPKRGDVSVAGAR